MNLNSMKTSIQPKALRSGIMMIMALALIALVPFAVLSQRSTGDAVKQQSSNSTAEQELINLSKEKWRWMSERKVDSLDALFHEKAVFVHMGATMTKTQELEVINFLCQYSLKGKTVIPFNTNARYGEGSSFQTVRELCPQSTVLEGFVIRGGLERDGEYLVIKGARAEEAQKEVESWLRGIKMLQ